MLSIITKNPSCKTHEGFFLVFGNQFVKLFLLGFHDGFADHSDVVVIDSDRDRDDFVFFGKAERAEDIFELLVGDDDAVFFMQQR